MIRLLAICAVLFAIVAGTIAWSFQSGGDRTPADFTFVNRGDHKTLDLGHMSWLQDIRVAYALWEGLYTLDPKTLAPIPGVAERLEVDPTQKVYTFHLRHAARWSNGDSVTTKDFVFGWRRLLEQPAEYTSLFFYIQGAKDYDDAYAAWVDQSDKDAGPPKPPPDFASVGIKALDDYTLQVKLRNPTPFFLSLCAFPSFFPQHEPSMRPFAQIDPKTGRVTSYDEGFTRPPHLVSNGPYRLAEWVFKRKARYVASDYYWNKASLRNHIIDEPVIEEPLAEYRAYLSGQVDWIMDLDENLVGQLRRAGRTTDLHIYPGFGTYFYVLNCQDKLPDGRANPLADVRVREALAMSIDKRPILENVTKSGQPMATHYIPPGIFPGYPSPPGQVFNLAKARQLLADAGYPGGRGFPPLQIIFNQEYTQHGDIALIIRSQWQANLGIKLDLQQLEIKVFAARLFARDFAVARASWIGDYPDPTTFTDKFKSDNDDNNAGWSNKQYDALCAAAETQTDPVQRMRTLAQAESVLLHDVPVIPLYHYMDAHTFRSNMNGIAVDSRDMSMFQLVWKSP